MSFPYDFNFVIVQKFKKMSATEASKEFTDKNEFNWEKMSSYKKSLFLQNPPDCSFLVSDDSGTAIFPAHKQILQSVSPIFYAMFQGSFKESRASENIELPDTDPKSFRKFLDFIYYGNVENLRSADSATIRNLIYMGKKYQVDLLTAHCMKIMEENLESAENCDLISTFEYACLMEDKKLLVDCKRVIVDRVQSHNRFRNFNFNVPQDEKRNILTAKHSTKQGNQSTNKPTGGSVLTSNGFGSLSTSNGFGTSSTSNCFGTSSTSNGSVTPLIAPPPQPLWGCALSSTSNGNNGAFGTCFHEVIPLNDAQNTPKSAHEDKILNTQINANNTESSTNSTFLGLSKGNITECSYIWDLDPSVFHEFQMTLSGKISEIARFKMIEIYAKIKGLIDYTDYNNSNETLDKEESNKTEHCQMQQTSKDALTKKFFLNMMLNSIQFNRMSPKEFCNGPGKSTALTPEEKYDFLVSIVNKD